MYAYVLSGINNLEYKSVPVPVIKPGWVLVEVKAAGICSSDIPRIFTKGTYHFPTIPGHEFSGIVKSIGESVNPEWLNKRVGVFPLIPCRACEQCKEKRYEMCENYDYTGSRRDGAFAEYVSVPEWNLIELDDSVTFKEAAMLEPLSVALHAVKRCRIKSGDSVGVIGTGMIGFAAAQWAKIYGASYVAVIGRNYNKKHFASIMNGINYLVLNELNENKMKSKDLDFPKFDSVIEAVGSSASINEAVELAKPSGHIILMGNPEGDITLKQNVYWSILRKQLHVSGTWNSSYRGDWLETLDALKNKKINAAGLISHTYTQERLRDGLELMRTRKELYCKVITIWNKEDE